MGGFQLPSYGCDLLGEVLVALVSGAQPADQALGGCPLACGDGPGS
jgi:hypothetical protein